MTDRFSEGWVDQEDDGTFTLNAQWDDIEIVINFDSINVDLIRWKDKKSRCKSIGDKQLDQVKNACNDRLLDDTFDLFQNLADIFDDVLNDGFKFDDNAEIMFGDD